MYKRLALQPIHPLPGVVPSAVLLRLSLTHP
jgi:hypothetical protein